MSAGFDKLAWEDSQTLAELRELGGLAELSFCPAVNPEAIAPLVLRPCKIELTPSGQSVAVL